MARLLAHDVDHHPVMRTLKEAEAATWLLYGLEDGIVPEEHERAVRFIAMKALSEALTATEEAYREAEKDGSLRSFRTP